MADGDLQQFKEIRFRYSSKAAYLVAIVVAIVVCQASLGLLELVTGDDVSPSARVLVQISLLVPLVSLAPWLSRSHPMKRTQLVISPEGILRPLRADDRPLPWPWVARIILETPGPRSLTRRVFVVFRDDLDDEDRSKVVKMNNGSGTIMSVDMRLLVDENTGATLSNAALLDLMNAYCRRFSPPPAPEEPEDAKAYSSAAWTGLD